MEKKRRLLAGTAITAPALCIAAADYFFRYTFTRADKPDPWVHGKEMTVFHDRAFTPSPIYP